MAGEAVDSDYHGRPVRPAADAERPDLTDEDLHAMCDATADTLPDGRHVWRCWDGTFLDKDGYPDRSRPIDHKWPTVEEMLAEADRRAAMPINLA